jgi:uncharacterized Fe-S cluster-containing MiaB family protein
VERSKSLVLQVGGLTCRWQRHSVKTFCCECSTIVEQAKTQLRVVKPFEEAEEEKKQKKKKKSLMHDVTMKIKEEGSFFCKLDLNLRRRLVKYNVWSIAFVWC